MKKSVEYDLSQLGTKWLELKKQRMQNLLKIALPDEALYREIMLSLGYPKNKANFLELALLIPYSEIKKLKNQKIIEQALLFRAGFTEEKEDLHKNFDFSLRMDKSVWIYTGIRPANFPEKRIKGISNLLASSTQDGLIDFFTTKIKSEIRNPDIKLALKNIMNFAGIGHQRKEEMFFNIIMPFVMVYSQNHELHNFLKFIFENYPPLKDNRLIKLFKQNYPEVKIVNVKTYMGALFFQKENLRDE